MGRATWVLAATTVVGFGTSAYLFLDRDDDHHACAPTTTTAGNRSAKSGIARNACAEATREAALSFVAPREAMGAVGETPASQLERRARTTRDVAALLGRSAGETDEQYRSRLGMLIRLGLAAPRENAAEMRKLAEAKAGVSTAQSAQLDHAFDKVYAEILEYTDKAIADRQLSPYERNVAAWLEVAGGLGGVLGNARGQIEQILDPAQVRAMYEAGFDWNEYLGLHTPWEKLGTLPPSPPPPAK